MMTIGICDDEKECRDRIRECCQQYFANNEEAYQCMEFTSGRQVLAYTGDQIDLLFLDIEMGEVSGLEVLQKVERSDRVWRIVFVSSHGEIRWETIHLKTLAFLDKPVIYEAVAKCIRITIQEKGENQKFSFETDGGQHCVLLDEIYWMEAQRNYVEVHTKQGKNMVYSSIKK